MPGCADRALVLRQLARDRSLLVALSVEDEPVTRPVPGAAGVLAGAGALATPPGGVTDGQPTLPPHGWAVLDVRA